MYHIYINGFPVGETSRSRLLPTVGETSWSRFPSNIAKTWRGTGPRPTVNGTFFHRSAGACPPRSLACPRAWSQIGAGFTRFTRLARLGAGDCSSGSPDPERRMARRTPSGPVARGPVPREHPTRAKNARQPSLFPDRGTARDRPSPYGKRHVVLTVARGPVPRDRSTRAKNARRLTPFPSRSRHGEGQALALR